MILPPLSELSAPLFLKAPLPVSIMSLLKFLVLGLLGPLLFIVFYLLKLSEFSYDR